VTYEIKRIDGRGNESVALIDAEHAIEALTTAKRLRPVSLVWQVLDSATHLPILTDYPEQPQGRPFRVWIHYRNGSGESLDTVAPCERGAIALVSLEHAIRQEDVRGWAVFDLENSRKYPTLLLPEAKNNIDISSGRPETRVSGETRKMSGDKQPRVIAFPVLQR
jgi:hypothetical protein